MCIRDSFKHRELRRPVRYLADRLSRTPFCVGVCFYQQELLPQSKLGLYFTHGATSFMRGCRPVRVPVGAWASPRRGLYHACGACPPPLAKGCLAGILFSVFCSFRRDCAREARLIVVFVFVLCFGIKVPLDESRCTILFIYLLHAIANFDVPSTCLNCLQDMWRGGL